MSLIKIATDNFRDEARAYYGNLVRTGGATLGAGIGAGVGLVGGHGINHAAKKSPDYDRDAYEAYFNRGY